MHNHQAKALIWLPFVRFIMSSLRGFVFKKHPWGFLAWGLPFDVSIWWKSHVLYWGFANSARPSKVCSCCRFWLLVVRAIIVWHHLWEFLWIAPRYCKTLIFQVSVGLWCIFNARPVDCHWYWLEYISVQGFYILENTACSSGMLTKTLLGYPYKLKQWQRWLEFGP